MTFLNISLMDCNTCIFRISFVKREIWERKVINLFGSSSSCVHKCGQTYESIVKTNTAIKFV